MSDIKKLLRKNDEDLRNFFMIELAWRGQLDSKLPTTNGLYCNLKVVVRLLQVINNNKILKRYI